LDVACRARNINLHIPPPKLCTDNAVMGALAIERIKAGLVESLDLDVYPGVVRGETATAQS
jgi:tRNA N6-adenosine threonylcarbamoyltransferase